MDAESIDFIVGSRGGPHPAKPSKSQGRGGVCQQVKIAQGANKSAKKIKVLAGLTIFKRKAVSNMDSNYCKKLFCKPKSKKNTAEKEKN